MYPIKKYKEIYYEAAMYIYKTHCSIRKAADKYHLCKSTLHSYIHRYFKNDEITKYNTIREQFDRNFYSAPYRGGMATKRKWENIRKEGEIDDGA